MENVVKWMLRSLVIAVTLAGCMSFATPAGSTPAASPTFTLALVPVITQTPVLAPTLTVNTRE